MEDRKLDSLRQQNGRLRSIVKDKLGEGTWGLVKNNENFSHEEILFLFARIFPALGIDYIKAIRTNLPDCICVKDEKEIGIEIEPVLSAFNDHLRKDDLRKCQYIVCWKDDLNLTSNMMEQINKNNIQIIQLKQLYEEGIVKERERSIEYTTRDFMKMSENRLKVMNAFISLDKNILTTQEIMKFTDAKGKALGGTMQFPSSKEWIIRRHPRGWEFNSRYRQKIIDTFKTLKFFT